MAYIIRHREVQSVNRTNKWPSNGLFTHSNSRYEKLDRHWFNVSINDFSTLVGNVFEQTSFNMVTFNICAKREQTASSPVLNVSVDRASIGVMPIEGEECHSIEQFLARKITTALYTPDVFEFQVTCYVKGWFWS